MLTTQYMLQVMGSLLLVLAAVFALAFVLKRLNVVQGSKESPIQVLASAKVGTREKLMLVRVADQVLVLGAAPGNLRTLHTFAAEDAAKLVAAGGDNTFAAMLRSARAGEGKL